jgi:hypothetical protein
VLPERIAVHTSDQLSGVRHPGPRRVYGTRALRYGLNRSFVTSLALSIVLRDRREAESASDRSVHIGSTPSVGDRVAATAPSYYGTSTSGWWGLRAGASGAPCKAARSGNRRCRTSHWVGTTRTWYRSRGRSPIRRARLKSHAERWCAASNLGATHHRRCYHFPTPLSI